MNKRIILATAITGLVGLTLVIVGKVSAFGLGQGNTNNVSELAQKLGVSEDKVTQAVSELRTERQAEMQKQFESQLEQYVKDGKITSAQKDLILKKHTELQAQRETEMQARRQHRTELESWATQNGIDLQYLPFGNGGGHEGRGMGMGRGGW